MKKTSKSTDHGGEEAEKKKLMSCDFCRNPKKPKFSKKHIPVTDTEGGECQGATFYLKVYNTETVPLSEEKKAALEAEKAKEKKKKKGLKAGLTPEEKQKQADEEYKTMLKAVEAEKKQNRKIALEKIRKVDQEFVDLLKPAWYQELSFKQMLYVETLGDALREDLLEGRLSRTPCILAGLGLNPLPNIKIVHTAAHKCFMNPLFFLLYLYKYYGKTPLLNTEKYYPPNDCLMLSAVTYLALPRTLLELQVRLPVLPPKPFEYYPAVPKMRKKTYTSPYLEPQPYLKHYYEDAHRKDVILRRAYLYKLALLKQLVAEEKRIEMEVVGGRVMHMRYSRKPNGQDQIRTGDEVTPRISLAPDKSYPMPSWKRKKKSYCPEGKKKRRPRPIPPSACGALGSPCVKIHKATDVVESYLSDITTEFMIHHNKVQTLSASENVTESETEINEKPVSLDDERGDNSNFESSLPGERKPVDDNDNGKDEESESTKQFMAKGRGSIENRSGQQHLSEDSGSSKNILSTGDQQSNITGMLYEGADDFQSSVSVAIEEEDQDTSVIKTAYPQPLFLTLQAQFPRPYWCSKDYSLRPQFSTKVCGYVPPPEKNEAEAEASVVKVDSQAFLYRKCMQLPHPIPTIPTLKALLNGYWDQTIVFSRPQLLTQEDVTLLKTLGEEAFRILAKKHLEDMANEGNPIACFPGITDLPEIRKLIRTCAEFKLTKKLKDKLMQRSLALWDKAIAKRRRIKLEEMKMPNKKWTWDDIVPFKKMVHKHAFEYRQKVRRAVLNDTRDFWATTFMDHYENPGFRNVFFSYLPSREDDILFPIM